jgi:peroxiredoxin
MQRGDQKMKKIHCYLLLFIWMFLPLLPLFAADRPPQVGEALPELALPAPVDSQDKAYLGVSGRGSFSVSQVQAPVVLLQVLSMYCPYCQKEAPNVNSLFKMIESDNTLKGKIKIIGIGAGNSAYETNLFRKKYSVPFTVLPDPDFIVYQKIGGEVRTPYFIAVRNQSGKQPVVVYSALGGFGDPAKFIQQLIRSAGVK